jgi:general secretion pathway protein G
LIMKIGRALHKRAKGEKGFTLIELIVVVAVLGVLATLVIPKVVNIKGDAEKATKDANKKILINALERYNAQNGSYPKTDELQSKLVPDYLDEIPTGWTYTSTNGSKYELN